MRTWLSCYCGYALLIAVATTGCGTSASNGAGGQRSAPERRVVRKEPTQSPSGDNAARSQPRALVVVEPHAPASDDGILAPICSILPRQKSRRSSCRNSTRTPVL